MADSSDHPRRFTFVLLFVAIFTAAFSALHVFIFLVNSRSIEQIFHIQLLKSVLVIGLFTMPIGFLLTKIKFKPLSVITWSGYIWMGIFTLLFFFSLVELFITVFFDHSYSFWPIYFTLIICPIALYKGIKLPEISRYNIQDTRLPDFSLIQISDLHVGMLHIREKWLTKVVHTILNAKPDVLCITGDLVEASFQEIETELNVFKLLAEIPYKFYITGNHEYIHGGSIWEKKLDSLGFKVLHNSNYILNFNNKKILIGGVPDKMVSRFIKSKKSIPDLALKTEEIVDYKILLAHQPTSVFDLHHERCDLMLSGHTHGGQIFPFHLLVRLVQPVVSGFKTIKGVRVFAHQGTGFWGPPMRWYSRSEIAEFKFSKM
jgi:predicted MPP superfamily phosphohydrolase